MHSPYIFKAISRIFSWSIVKYFEPRNCFWDSVVTVKDKLFEEKCHTQLYSFARYSVKSKQWTIPGFTFSNPPMNCC